jgi:tRNA(Ile)-lysidine synthase
MIVSERALLKRVAECISRYSMFEHGHKVGVAVSGGADSVCLLHVLLELAPRWALRLRVLHLNHGLRGEESREDAVFVREMAARLGLEADIEETDVGRLRAESGANLEEAAREARRRFFLKRLSAGLVDRVALGHTRSDQAETVLFRFLRGCGTLGLAGILPVTREGFVRPLAGVDRAETKQYLRGRNIPWREDSSNQDPAYARNRIRHELLPALERDWNPSLSETLAHMATLAQDEENYWDAEIGRLAGLHLARKAGAVLLRAESLRNLARPVARRLVRRAIQDAKGDLRRTEFNHIEAVLGLADKKSGHGRIQVPELDVLRSFDWIRLVREDAAGQDAGGFRLPLSVPGTVDIPGSDSCLRLEMREGPSASNEMDYGLDGERAPGPLELRNWRPGDQYWPLGYTGPEKMKLLFQKHKVPLWERRKWPIIVSGETILWVRRFGPAAEYAATPLSRRVIGISETERRMD